jgi:hypothetical protein
VTVAANEPEAAVIVGFLDSRGITASYEEAPSPLGGIFPTAGSGLYEIVVRAEDLEAAQAALAEADDDEELR